MSPLRDYPVYHGKAWHSPSPSPPSEEPGTILFETERLVVRRLLPSGAPAMALAGNDPSVAANLRSRFPSPYHPHLTQVGVHLFFLLTQGCFFFFFFENCRYQSMFNVEEGRGLISFFRQQVEIQ